MSTGDFNNDLQVDIYDLNYLLDNWKGTFEDSEHFNALEGNWNTELNLPNKKGNISSEYSSLINLPFEPTK